MQSAEDDCEERERISGISWATVMDSRRCLQ
jgi:hypothetical protein